MKKDSKIFMERAKSLFEGCNCDEDRFVNKLLDNEMPSREKWYTVEYIYTNYSLPIRLTRKFTKSVEIAMDMERGSIASKKWSSFIRFFS